MISNLALLLVVFLSDGAASMAVKGLMIRCGGEVCDGVAFVSGPSVWATSPRTW